MIISSIPGRIRFRHRLLLKSVFLERVERRLKQEKGICSVKTNHHSGSLLVVFDASITAVEQVVERVNHYLSSPLIGQAGKSGDLPPRVYPGRRTPASGKKRVQSNGLNGSLLATLGVSLLGLAMNDKKLHTQAGLAFLGLVGKHVFRYKHRIWRSGT